MKPRYLALCILGAFPGACATEPAPDASTQGDIYGYHYHDANHLDGVTQPSAQAIHSATHGVWLWPPVQNDKPD
jgi:hypothetical protein